MTSIFDEREVLDPHEKKDKLMKKLQHTQVIDLEVPGYYDQYNSKDAIKLANQIQ